MPDTVILMGEERMEKTLESLKKEFTNIRKIVTMKITAAIL